eukprot:1459847-Prymnesium_polylepis.1
MHEVLPQRNGGVNGGKVGGTCAAREHRRAIAARAHPPPCFTPTHIHSQTELSDIGPDGRPPT